MNLDIRAFPFIISPAAVINGLGIVREHALLCPCGEE